MSELYELWSEIYVNEQLEDEVVKLIFMKIQNIKEQEH